ncbi:MAG: hypothetical protein C5B50_15485 [Verrucomicrobia bacterium]|nr:MAG: hypothetical protein C5B50_15485 [Verrucomicrobiota bacterium]
MRSILPSQGKIVNRIELTEKFMDKNIKARKFHGKKIKNPFSCRQIFLPAVPFIFLSSMFLSFSSIFLS